MIAIDISKQQAVDADPKVIKQINFTGNLENKAVIVFIIKEAKETVLDFSQETVKVLYQYNTLNVKLSNLQLNMLKSGIKNGTEVTLKISSNVVGDSNDENDFPHELFLTNTQVAKHC